MAYIQELTDESGESVYPVTKTNAVYDTNGHRLSDSMLTVGEPVEKLEDIKINADTLGGKEASIYIPFPDYSSLIDSGKINIGGQMADSTSYTEYLAIKDCFMIVNFYMTTSSIHGFCVKVNNSVIYGSETDFTGATGSETICTLWLKKGDIVRMKGASNNTTLSNYKVYGLR